MNATEQKAAIRARISAHLKSLGGMRTVASAALCERIRSALLSRGQTFVFYAPMRSEPDVWPLLREALRLGKRVALPRYDNRTGEYELRLVADADADVVRGQFGIREPGAQCPLLAPAVADWILVPGIAFDRQGRRLGRGRGFFDRLLSGVSARRCGVAFDDQVLDELPAEAHDQRMDAVVTPTRWLEWESPKVPGG